MTVIVEQITGLLMDCGRMYANVRFDYAQLWDEIKEFTRIDGDGVKLLLLSKDWNIVVGSFDALFVSANEKSFCRFLMLSFMKSERVTFILLFGRINTSQYIIYSLKL